MAGAETRLAGVIPVNDRFDFVVKWVSNHDPQIRGCCLERYRTRYDATEAANQHNHVYRGAIHHWASKSEGEPMLVKRSA